MKKKWWRRAGTALLAAALMLGLAVPAAAASRKKITSVSLTVDSEMKIGDDMDLSQVEVETESDKYYVESFDFTNTGFYWAAEDVPQIEVYLNAEEGYYFSLMSSDVHLKGATYVSASKPSGMDSTVLKITMDLPSMAGRMSELETVTLGADGIAAWEPVEGAGHYEVRLIRNSTTVGGTQSVEATSMDLGYLMTKSASYTVKVRPVSQVNWENKGQWTSSSPVYVDSAAAERFREASQPAGQWIQDETGWWFQNEDGTYTVNGWQLINGKWYYFDGSGYMMTNSWVESGGYYYYVGEDGAMLKSTYVPGTEYYVNSSGAWVQ